MSLAPGTRFGPYEILAAIGAGGMGEVYRAHDTKLGRDVALKILPESFVHDPDRVARFRREAQVLASLNHPHIGAIYGLEEANGSQFLVLELVEGGTLADRLKSGPLPVDEALTVAKQIADALEAAHDKGIIHRDLKPANIAFTANGQVKVLDFGLAKALEPVVVGSTVSNSPTLTLAVTQAGAILGTAAYMSPEQARGQVIDKRCDIWAFGCVLYEILTGRPGFARDTVSDTIVSVLDREPDWGALPTTTPDPVDELLHRCLEKDPKLRLRDIGDASLELRQALKPVEATDRSPGSRRGLLRSGRAVAFGLGLLGGSLFGSGVAWIAMRTPPAPVTRLAVNLSNPMEFALGGVDRDVTISPDGSNLVYVAPGGGQLVVRALDRLNGATLEGLGDPRHPFMSPDGQWIGFFDGISALKRVSISGGSPQTICSVGDAPRGASWGPDGSIVFASSDPASGLLRVASEGGKPVVLTTPDQSKGEQDHLWPEFLPTGKAVLFTVVSVGSTANRDIAVLNLQTGERKVVVRGGSHAYYVPTGHLVYAAGATLRAVAFDLTHLEAKGAPVPVLDEVITTPSGAANFSVSRNGTLVYVSGGAQSFVRTLAWVDRKGRETPIAVPPRSYVYPRLSPDGSRVALEIRDQENDIWILDVGRETLTQLTFGPAVEQFPLWTPDGRWIVYASGRSGVRNLYRQRADGTGEVERLTDTRVFQTPSAFSPDGLRMLIVENDPATGIDLKLLSLKGERTEPLVNTRFSEQNAELSPDGRWFAYQSNESGRNEIHVRPFPKADAGHWMISSNGGTRPLWQRDGKELFYVSNTGELMTVPLSAGESFTFSAPKKLFDGGRYYMGAAGAVGRTYEVSPDGQRFLMIKPVLGGAASAGMIVVQNWSEELKQRVPTR